ncbi:Histone-lysine N-methyltransferase SETMAR [Habropoda laboriosa]|uniref:Histone-lysine N-methyltransferase SETMAR n=1 Tax=Habropoda laboriosa TaxID=597456 RepID=A0A0L7QYV1_9HYME|nr:Histone-lysine N-methyltransferase SETMAR [Habropoda laboriosa]
MGIEVPPRPPYSPDLSPIDFHFFHSLDNFLTRKRFGKQEGIENAPSAVSFSERFNFYIRELMLL